MWALWNVGLVVLAKGAVLAGGPGALRYLAPLLGVLPADLRTSDHAPALLGGAASRRDGVTAMEGFLIPIIRFGDATEIVLAAVTGLLLLVWLVSRIVRGMVAPWAASHRHTARGSGGSAGSWPRRAVLPIVLAAVLAPTLAAAQGWWWGSPVNPGFDRSTVIQVTGTATHISMAGISGPGTLILQCPHETYTVVLAPVWYLTQLGVQIREGDALTVEGSKMMDRRGQLHLVAARVTNERTGAVLELRDDGGRPRWMGGPRSGRMMR